MLFNFYNVSAMESIFTKFNSFSRHHAAYQREEEFLFSVLIDRALHLFQSNYFFTVPPCMLSIILDKKK